MKRLLLPLAIFFLLCACGLSSPVTNGETEAATEKEAFLSTEIPLEEYFSEEHIQQFLPTEPEPVYLPLSEALTAPLALPDPEEYTFLGKWEIGGPVSALETEPANIKTLEIAWDGLTIDGEHKEVFFKLQNRRVDDIPRGERLYEQEHLLADSGFERLLYAWCWISEKHDHDLTICEINRDMIWVQLGHDGPFLWARRAAPIPELVIPILGQYQLEKVICKSYSRQTTSSDKTVDLSDVVFFEKNSYGHTKGEIWWENISVRGVSRKDFAHRMSLTDQIAGSELWELLPDRDIIALSIEYDYLFYSAEYEDEPYHSFTQNWCYKGFYALKDDYVLLESDSAFILAKRIS